MTKAEIHSQNVISNNIVETELRKKKIQVQNLKIWNWFTGS